MDIEELLSRFIDHVNKLRSARFVCSAQTAVEGWFRVEVVPVLEDMGIPLNRINPRFHINGGQADLAVEKEDGYVVFEFMCFVKGADSEKKRRFPQQLDRLERAVTKRRITQGIAFVTFSGYSNTQPENLIKKFFGKRDWKTKGPLEVVSGHPLRICLGSFNNPRDEELLLT